MAAQCSGLQRLQLAAARKTRGFEPKVGRCGRRGVTGRQCVTPRLGGPGQGGAVAVVEPGWGRREPPPYAGVE